MRHPDGSSLEGEWRDDQAHGNMVDTYPNGDKEYGEWVKGEKEGIHMLTTMSKERYTVIYQNGDEISRQRAGLNMKVSLRE